MPDNLPPDPTGRFALPGHRVLALEGRDAVAFAQAQFMNEVAALPAGHWLWNGWLTPKGRVIALFALLRVADDQLWLLLPDADPEALAEGLRRYLFRSKVTIAPRADLHASGAFTGPRVASSASLAGDPAMELELDFGAAGGARTLWIASTEAPGDAAAAARWDMEDLLHGVPRLPASQGEQWTPQMLSLQRLQAFSVKKGCYPGQEIVARTHFLGQSKRGLALLEGSRALEAGVEVHDQDRPVGHLVCAADCGERHLGLAVLPLEREDRTLLVDGVPVQERPLLDGLAR